MNGPRRWLLAAVAVALAVSGCALDPGGAPASSRAAQICQSFVPASVTTLSGAPLGAALDDSSWTTAGQITTLAKHVLGHPLHPWDSLPASRFVAECGFPLAAGTTSTTDNCPPGDLPAPPDPSEQYYVDGDGHSTPAIPLSSTDQLPNACAVPLLASPTTTSGA